MKILEEVHRTGLTLNLVETNVTPFPDLVFHSLLDKEKQNKE